MVEKKTIAPSILSFRYLPEKKEPAAPGGRKKRALACLIRSFATPSADHFASGSRRCPVAEPEPRLLLGEKLSPQATDEGNSELVLPVAEQARPEFPQRSKNARIGVSPQHFSGTARRTAVERAKRARLKGLSFLHSFIPSFLHSFISSFLHSFIPSFLHSPASSPIRRRISPL